MNQFFPVCVACLATLFFSTTVFSPSTKGAEPPPDAENVAPNRTIIIPMGYDAMKAEKMNAAVMEHAPIIRSWSGISFNTTEPCLIFALWRDGTIIWSKSDDKNLSWWYDESEHFQSKISVKQVEDFLSAFDKVGFLEFSGKAAPRLRVVGPGPGFFLLETENVQFSFTMDFIFWKEGNPGASRSMEHQQMSAKWRAVKGLLLELIPEKGEQISLSIEEEKDKRQWKITPVPLRPADRPRAEENARENNRPGNWGQIPLRAR